MRDSEGADTPDGPSPPEVGMDIAGEVEHPDEDPSSGIWRSRRFEHNDHNGRQEWLITGIEAVLMVVLAVLAVYAGYSSARWSTDSRLMLTQASTASSQFQQRLPRLKHAEEGRPAVPAGCDRRHELGRLLADRALPGGSAVPLHHQGAPRTPEGAHRPHRGERRPAADPGRRPGQPAAAGLSAVAPTPQRL